METSVDQYGLKGDSICLAVAEPEILKGLKWKTGSDIIVDDEEISPCQPGDLMSFTGPTL